MTFEERLTEKWAAIMAEGEALKARERAFNERFEEAWRQASGGVAVALRVLTAAGIEVGVDRPSGSAVRLYGSLPGVGGDFSLVIQPMGSEQKVFFISSFAPHEPSTLTLNALTPSAVEPIVEKFVEAVARGFAGVPDPGSGRGFEVQKRY